MAGLGELLAGAARAAGLGLPAHLVAAIAAAAAESGGLGPELPGAVYQAELAGRRAGRRAVGAFYSPPHLVDFAVDRALGAALDGTADPSTVRVVDPAAGAGVFLFAALARLEAAAVAAGATVGARLRARLARGLTGIDRDPIAADLARLGLALAVHGDAALSRPSLIAGLADRIVTGDALAGPPVAADVVLGNPPWGQKGFRLAPAERARLRGEFTVCARGVIDPFAPFVELAHRMLAPGGRWALILPDVVLLKDHEAVRSFILAGSAIEWIAHAGRAFPGVNLDAVVVVGRRAAAPPRHKVSVWHQLPVDWRRAAPRRQVIAQRTFAGLPGRRFNLYLDRSALAELARLDPLPRLAGRFEIHEGVHSGNARAKLFRRERPTDGAPLIVGGREVARYRLAWAGRWLDRSPTALDRAAGDYANLGRRAWHECAKIVVRRTGDHVVAALDDDGRYVSNNLFVVVPRAATSRAELAATTALLNSRLATWYFRTVAPRVGRLFAELKIHHLASIPLPPPARWRPSTWRGLAALHDRAVEAAADGDTASLAALAARIDARVDSLFDLSRVPGRSTRLAR